MSGSNQYSDLPEVAPIEASYRHATVTDSFPEPVYVPKLDGLTIHAVAGEGKNPDRKIWGLKRTTFFILVGVAAIVIIGAIVGGVVGSRANSTTSTSESATPTSSASATSTPTSSPISILSNSRIASVNWTDSNDQHYFVFYQNEKNDLIASSWDSQNKTWEARSISASIKSAGDSLDVIEGTPISAVAWSDSENAWNIRVYVLITGNYIAELLTSRPTKDSEWSQTSFGSQVRISPAEGSNIAAWRPNGGNETWPQRLLMWENADQKLIWSSSDNWDDYSTFSTIKKSSSLSVTSVSGGGNISNPRWRLYYDNDELLQEGMMEPNFVHPTYSQTLGNIASSSNTNFAAVCFNLVYTIIVDLNDQGGIRARWYNKSTWSTSSEPNLADSPDGMSVSSGFTAISGHADRRIYGIVNGTIHEWSFDTTTPMTWTYVGEVTKT
ncbi:hypothetical protein BGZ61DRAFT_584329 [Ilyonectria robusta]|uniref:uncharacterized protein n=1 Tax=Ilyonectria robusta TaxID=1079257 RepID=UPI001E8D3F47|nr:uncharacterized protein BGZ61DRAFT_584329 [Ilyonectria robusta]KAH8734285.1 hypothetical protein BGZ61DRAFT_584329 [Ilyonectria robusta]